MSKSPAFPRAAPNVHAANLQADAVRAEPDELQTVTSGCVRDGAAPGAHAFLLADSSTGGIAYNSTSRRTALAQAVAGERARGERAASGAVALRGLVSSRISARNEDRRTVTLDVGFRDVRIHRSLGLKSNHKRPGGGRRGAIVEFSAASARRLLFCARNFPALEVMVTLTYPAEYPVDGRRVMNHWRRMRQWLVRNGNPVGLWFKEFQARGAPHFHVFMPTEVPKAAVAEAWYSIVGSGDLRHLRAGTRTERLRNPDAAGAYAAKYASKSLQKEVPEEFRNVGRFWGTWGNPSITETVVLRGSEAVSVVRTVRRGYESRRKEWNCRRRFRDNGRAGFTGWESGALAAQAVQRLTGGGSDLILGREHPRPTIGGPYRSGGWANPTCPGVVNVAHGSRETEVALSAHAHSIDQVRPWPNRLE